VSPLRAVGATSKPVLLIHSVDDLSVPFSDGLELRAAMARNEHGSSFSPSGTEDERNRAFARQVRSFFATALGE
jgi:hypothetical protein